MSYTVRFPSTGAAGTFGTEVYRTLAEAERRAAAKRAYLRRAYGPRLAAQVAVAATAPAYDAETAARVRAAVVEGAEAALARYPQYAGHWDGPEWFLIRLTKRVRTKLAVAFEPGGITLAKVDQLDARFFGPGETPRPFTTAWSQRNRIDTSVRPGDFERVEVR